MELNLSELNNVNTMNPYQSFDHNFNEHQNGVNYWEKTKKQELNIKKKKVTFDDILSNMNLVVNKQGVLQMMAPNQPEEQNYNHNQYQNQYQNQNSNNSRYQYQNYNQHPTQYHQNYSPQIPEKQVNSQPLDPSVKHSYIYNKYFKDYSDPNVQKQGPRIPKTIEEYKQMLLEDKIKAIQHKQKIEQIKSKKMLFTTNPGMGINPRNIQVSRNNLRSMSFR